MKGVGGFDIIYDDYEETCRETLDQIFNYL